MIYFIGFSQKDAIFIPILKRENLRFRDYSSLLDVAQLVGEQEKLKPGKSDSRA